MLGCQWGSPQNARESTSQQTTVRHQIQRMLCLSKKVKLGRPLNSANFDKNQYSTYPSYHAISSAKNPLRANRCWLAAALETLYAVFSPLWLRGINGTVNNLFSYLVQHFTSQETYELNLKGTIQSILNQEQSKISDFSSKNYPDNDVTLNPKLHKSTQPGKLFVVNERRKFTCKAQPDVEQSHPTWQEQYFHVLVISPAMFGENRIPYDDVAKLIQLWQSTGI
ncbi:uncharacterized protein PGTG_22561 [Puccinia graminis f. sp. tritici CRL 75-36-700-3]|uniref:Uncharacterized protein n=1 Tax=Puccinia graminis f. sp. tritici (strain CRL 75-36-700-3 / race SCCL) TaxID=418459 RepID=H6QUZ5_PUCGT|nr:uncharacterized protein PGTG_22561 [Puccinia graminis f. sp. tritici CRL 75-36-700-3]EHS62608.1 hypothetical protein PGTG_22561 [Puccinia graminis f. sp. tritici CRL 75-36-700-3]